ELGERGGVGADDRRAAGHGLDHGNAEPLVERGVGEDVGPRVKGAELRVRHVAGEVDVRGEGRLLRLAVGLLAQPALAAGDHQVVGGAGANLEAGESVDQARQVLARLDHAHLQDVRLREAVVRAYGGDRLRGGRLEGAVHAARHDEYAVRVDVEQAD